MSIRKFLGENPRAALRSVKAELGEDAVILSSRQVQGGFEVMALSQHEVDSLALPAKPVSGPPAAAPVVPTPSGIPAPGRPADPGPTPFMEYALGRTASRLTAATPADAVPVAVRTQRPAGATAPPAVGAGDRPPAHSAIVGEETLMAELRSMRSLLEGQLATLAWSDAARRAPLKMKLAGALLGAGFAPGFTRSATARLPDDFTAAQAGKWLSSMIEAGLRQPQVDTLIDRGGAYALVGPTGVGKTTTTAKLAARYVMKFGAQKLGLISADSYRIGGQDQLRAYGRILGVPVHTIQDAGELQATLAALRDKHLILIDTIGVGQRDPRVTEQVALLEVPRVHRLLLLNATSHGETLEDVVRAYRGQGLAGCCISKIDEAVKLGSVLGCAMQHHLPVHYVSNGQRVPEDLHLPNIPYLVHRALRNDVSEPNAFSDDESALMLASAGATDAMANANRH